jgi:hypothetical protein
VPLLALIAVFIVDVAGVAVDLRRETLDYGSELRNRKRQRYVFVAGVVRAAGYVTILTTPKPAIPATGIKSKDRE